MNRRTLSLGLDFGTNSVRALIVDVANGQEIATAVHEYESGRAGVLLDPADPNLARQNPADYMTGIEAVVKGVLAAAKRSDRSFNPAEIIGIGVDTTGSTPIPVDGAGTPLALQPEFRKNLAAQAWLWKDHTVARRGGRDHREGREAAPPSTWPSAAARIPREWFWSQDPPLQARRPRGLRGGRVRWVELADFVPGLLTGHRDPAATGRAAVCAAGHKAMYQRRLGRAAGRGVPGAARPEAGRASPAGSTPRPGTADTAAGRLDHAEVARRSSACRRASRWPSAPSTPTWAPSARASSRARWSRSSARAPAT